MWDNWPNRVSQRSIWGLTKFFTQKLFFVKVSREIIVLLCYLADFSIFILRDRVDTDFSINLAKTSVEEINFFSFWGVLFSICFLFCCFLTFVFLVVMVFYLRWNPCWRPAFNPVDSFEILQTISICEGNRVKSQFQLNIADVHWIIQGRAKVD